MLHHFSPMAASTLLNDNNADHAFAASPAQVTIGAHRLIQHQQTSHSSSSSSLLDEKMVRKRMASEMEIRVITLSHFLRN